jgi:pimeloyl-ACP methyl ester carboxylesterase
MATELHQLLAAVGAPPPYLLVGHSLGALIARAYTATHPQRVAGIVMVDAAVPQARLWPDPSALYRRRPARRHYRRLGYRRRRATYTDGGGSGDRANQDARALGQSAGHRASRCLLGG